jgi:CRISPR/Cas system-associated exonuclease Cas4 (RecB family)
VISRLREEALMSSRQIDQLEKTLAEVLAHPKLKNMFSGEGTAYTEHDLVTSQGEVIRPDRVVVKNNRASLIEYKTGKKKKEHINQVRKYADILRDIGFETGTSLLVYLDESPEVVALD